MPTRWSRLVPRTLLVVAVSGLGVHCAAPEVQIAPASPWTAPLTPCHVPGIRGHVLCGSLAVWEDRDAQEGRHISLELVVVPAISTPRPDPVFFLPGGPGQSAIHAAASMMPVLSAIHSTRDVVFVDPRGTGGSHPLDCGDARDASLLQRFGSTIASTSLPDCLAQLDADPRQYLTPTTADDLDEVRQALGYEHINLFGTSYGTRTGLVYLRRHAEHVRTAVLDGLTPPSMELFLHFAADSQAALDAMVQDCATRPACATAFPDLPTYVPEILKQLETSPDIQVIHPRTGEAVSLPIDGPSFASNLRDILYTPELVRLLPLALRAAHRGDFSPFVAQSAGLTDTRAPFSLGHMLSIVCTEDLPRITPQARAEAARDTFLGDTLVEEVLAACAQWPSGTLPDGYHEPIVSDVPTLLLSGALDPVTPPRWGEEAARPLSRARHAIAPGAGHDVASVGCTPEIIHAFMEVGSAESLDLTCIESISRPPFFVDLAGPVP